MFVNYKNTTRRLQKSNNSRRLWIMICREHNYYSRELNSTNLKTVKLSIRYIESERYWTETNEKRF